DAGSRRQGGDRPARHALAAGAEHARHQRTGRRRASRARRGRGPGGASRRAAAGHRDAGGTDRMTRISTGGAAVALAVAVALGVVGCTDPPEPTDPTTTDPTTSATTEPAAPTAAEVAQEAVRLWIANPADGEDAAR